MKETDPGHSYLFDNYPARESLGEVNHKQIIHFRKRIGADYPGNNGTPYYGTSTQELLRVIIARSKYVNNQEFHQANINLIRNARESLLDLEKRAAVK